MNATVEEITVPAAPLALARAWAQRAAYLAVAAEQVQDTHPESAAHLDWHAARNRRLARQEIVTALQRAYPRWTFASWEYHSWRITGDLMRDAYAQVRAGGDDR